jgi:hypothetical protein
VGFSFCVYKCLKERSENMSNQDINWKSRNQYSNYVRMLDAVKHSDETSIKKSMCEKVLDRIYADGDHCNILKNLDYSTAMVIADNILKDDEFNYVLDETIGSCIAEMNDKINDNINQSQIKIGTTILDDEGYSGIVERINDLSEVVERFGSPLYYVSHFVDANGYKTNADGWYSSKKLTVLNDKQILEGSYENDNNIEHEKEEFDI